PGRVVLAGEDVLRDFGETLAEAALDGPVAGRIALPREGSLALLWLLVDGVVTAHLTLPSAPPFAAVMEMRPRVGPGASPSAVRGAPAAAARAPRRSGRPPGARGGAEPLAPLDGRAAPAPLDPARCGAPPLEHDGGVAGPAVPRGGGSPGPRGGL